MDTTITTTPVISTLPPHIIVGIPTDPPHPATAKKQVFVIIGMLQMFIGILCVILGGVAATPSISGGFIYVGSGIWGGFWYIGDASLATSTGIRPTRCNIVAGIVIGIMTTMVALSVGIVEAVAANFPDPCDGASISSSPCVSGSSSGIHGTLAFFSFVAFFTAIAHAVFCCLGSKNSGGQQVFHVVPDMGLQAYPLHNYANHPYYVQQNVGPAYPTYTNHPEK